MFKLLMKCARILAAGEMVISKNKLPAPTCRLRPEAKASGFFVYFS